MTKITNYWPMPDSKPRLTQDKVFDWVEQLPSNIKYILCEVPVGGGKSPIALAISGWLANGLGSSCILTPQKILQKQYEDSFESRRLSSMYGRSNYECKPKKTNCDIGNKIKPACKNCPHANAYAKAKQAPNLVLNYKIALLYSMLEVEAFRERRLMVFDECHTLEHHLTEFLSLTISERMAKRYNVAWRACKTIPEALYYIEEIYYPAVKEELDRLNREVDRINSSTLIEGVLSKVDQQIIEDADEVEKHADLIKIIKMTDESELIKQYVLVFDKTYFKFKELYGKKIFKNFLENSAERFLFMSSTILDKDEFCRDLGLNPENAAFISLDSEFHKDNRPICYMPRAKMSFGWDSDERKHDRDALIDAVVGLLTENHKGDNGIIHTGSFQIAQWLVKELEGKIPHRIMHHNPKGELSRDEAIELFTASDDQGPKVLISPSLTEGLDLKDDKGRFSIFAKVPYPFLGDAWVKRRMEISQEWYSRQAMIAIIQGGGRVTRSADDWGYTYILDSTFYGLYKAMKNKLPKWWLEAFHYMK